MKLANYDYFAEFYDFICGNSNKFINYIKNKVAGKSKIKSILEIACGTGNVLIPFSRKYQCYGIDFSKNMLKIARKKSKRIEFKLADMRNFKLNKKFDLVFCVYDSINHLLTKKEWKQTFNRVHEHLNKKGLFLFDMNTLWSLKFKSKKGLQFYKTKSGYVLIDVLPLPFNKARWNIRLFKRISKDKYKLLNVIIDEKSFKISQVKKMLKTKFKIVEVKTFKNRTGTDKSRRVFFLCQKK